MNKETTDILTALFGMGAFWIFERLGFGLVASFVMAFLVVVSLDVLIDWGRALW